MGTYTMVFLAVPLQRAIYRFYARRWDADTEGAAA